MTMDKNQYKELIAEYMRREAKLKEQVDACIISVLIFSSLL